MPVSVKVIVPSLSSVVMAMRRGRLRLIRRLTRSLREAQLLAGVGRVRDQLAHEDLFVRVKRMDDDIQQLLDLGLKMMFFGRAHIEI